MQGDEDVVNCLEPHPHIAALATRCVCVCVCVCDSLCLSVSLSLTGGQPGRRELLRVCAREGPGSMMV